MPWLKWMPWRFVLRRLARSHGFLDPMTVLAGLQRFAQPSEVDQPVELLRAGALFHARGLINSRVIQHNLDWVWPYWIERQFDPADDAFVPRAFSITHVNLTHRNWTAIGWPECPDLPIIDPRGLLTPIYDGWSLDGWVIASDGELLLPSRADATIQRLELSQGPVVTTETTQGDLWLLTRASVEPVSESLVCQLQLEARSSRPGWLAVALRPYNPEGVSFINRIELVPERTGWLVDGKCKIAFSAPVDRHHVSDYRGGDVSIHLNDREDQQQTECDVGMATAAALFKLEAGQSRTITVHVPLQWTNKTAASAATWTSSLQGACALRIPDRRFQFLYDAGLHTLVLHSADDIYPGPYTYKRFWFRDAAFILHALLCAGFNERVERALDRFPARQTPTGYFRSQDGEWDSNGEALWIMRRFCEVTNRPPKADWWLAARRGANWIVRKRLKGEGQALQAGLFPAGFSAEHLGPNDYYYWDDFWGIAGLHAAAALAGYLGDKTLGQTFKHEAQDFRQALERSLDLVAERTGGAAMPASPYRRLDAGAIGSLAGGYPLQLQPPDDLRLSATVEFLLKNCFFGGGFFQDMIHSGINAYLTLHVAQVLLRAGDMRYRELMDAVAGMASPTGQWPEAIHPRTGGGCMGDGQHVWAAAEWILMMRHCFLREEGEALIMGEGIFPAWLSHKETLSFGPAPTAFGTVSMTIEPEKPASPEAIKIRWQAIWHGQPPKIELRLPGFVHSRVLPGETSARLIKVI
ncbi:conserved hypothetical protein [Candidatus Methylobacter favarea]|uniref:Uncharacterized protein n=1 Tax=Candidatus Methylobacter favarea TaxID=2707345 RepID=A0A8S0XKL1_9GAMM|nr:hypothetical protein [Candidatus Methylobacter favarea]CAA9892132.1 conserved hypothetical protein [Candidatus Methylobacter favarea]